MNCVPRFPVNRPRQALQGKAHLDVGSPDLAAFKKQTDIPNCPKGVSTGVAGGMPAVTLPCLGGGREVDTAGLRDTDDQVEKIGAALELAERSRVGYPLVADPSAALDKASPLPHIAGLPFTVFLDPHGKVVHMEAGAMLTEADVADAAQKYLGVGG